MFRLVTCVEAHCDQCRNAAELDDSFVHFPDQDEAVKALGDGGWRVLAGGRLLCPRCAAARDCAIYGHDFDSWRRCRCNGSVANHMRFLTMDAFMAGECPAAYRWCQRCDTDEERAASTVEVTE